MLQKGNLTLLPDLKKLPNVFITLDAITKILCFVSLTKGEINGLGIVEKRDNDFIITDAFILRQMANVVAAEIDPMALNEFVAGCEEPEKLKFQWHSHGDLSAFFSAEDQQTIAGYSNDFMISLVVNKNGEYECRLDIYQPFPAVFRVNLGVLLPPFENDLIRHCREEIREKVKPKPLAVAVKVLTGRDTRFETLQTRKPPVLPLENLSFEVRKGKH